MSTTRKVVVCCGFVFGVACLVVLGLTLVAVVRTLLLQEVDHFIQLEEVEYVMEESRFNRYVQVFSESLKFRTVSREPGVYDRTELLKMQKFLIDSFPLVFNASFIEVEIVNTYSILLTVKGEDSSLAPFMLTSHMDVVPVDPEAWSRPPFLGEIVPDPETDEDCIWGRGAIDDKAGVLGILSAMDLLIEKGWKPKRSFYVGFGHDEEVSGYDGAGHIGELLSNRNVTLDFLLDEGMPIVEGIMDGVEAPIALIGVTEKGRMEVKITAEGEGGHSSIPPKAQAVQRLSKALVNLYNHPQPSMFGTGPERDMLSYLAPKASWPYKMIFGNTWLFGTLLSYAMSLKSQADALQRTTTAVTIVNAGMKSNVVPAKAEAFINHRVHPSQSLEDVLAHDIYAVGNDHVKVEMVEGVGPHPVSPYGPDSVPFRLIAASVKYAYPQAVISPGLMVGNTDTRFYLNLTPYVYRFIPVLLNQNTVGSIHGKDERLTTSNFRSAILFYRLFIKMAEEYRNNTLPLSSRKTGEL